jgi:LacI family transcriptional regulator
MTDINDVAKLAGVSRGSVSNYLNGANLRPATKQKITAAIKQLQYLPNGTAQALKRQKTDYIVLILPRVTTPFFAELTEQIQLKAKKEQLKLILGISNNQAQNELEYLQMAQVQKVAGIITMSYADITPWLNIKIPLVTLEHRLTEQVPLISADNYAGGKLAAEKLITSGCQRLLFVGFAPLENSALQRYQGFLEKSLQQNIFCEQLLLPDERSLAIFLKKHFQEKNDFDGIFAVSDALAAQIWPQLLALDVRIPQDVELIGFDGIPAYHGSSLAISSIKQPVVQMAQAAVETLVHLIKESGSTAISPQILPVSFHQGNTTRR